MSLTAFADVFTCDGPDCTEQQIVSAADRFAANAHPLQRPPSGWTTVVSPEQSDSAWCFHSVLCLYEWASTLVKAGVSA